MTHDKHAARLISATRNESWTMSTKCYWVMTLVYYIYVYTCHTKMSHVRERWQIISHMTHFCVTWLISVWYLMTHRIHAAWLISATDMNICNGYEYRIWGDSYPLRIFISVLSDILPEKLLGDGFSTPMPPFCLICTIISNKTCILD